MDPDPDFARAIFQNIGQHWLKEEQCDLKIIIGDFMVLCNKFILCSCSEFFNVLLHSDHSYTNKAGHLTVKISGIEPDIFMLVLNSIFKGENRINEANMIDLLYAAHHLQIDFLKQKCEMFIADLVTLDNYLLIYPHSVNLKSDLILDKVLGIIAKYFDRFRQTQIFLNLSVQSLISIIERKDIHLFDSLVESILQWVEYEETLKSSEVSNNLITDNAIRSIDIESDNLGGFDQCLKEKEDGLIEVMFKNEILVLEKETTKRKDMIGVLINHVPLNFVSKQGLKLLLDNDIVMDNGEARNAVRKAIALQLDLEKQCKSIGCDSKSSTPTNLQAQPSYDNLIHVLIFLIYKGLPECKMIAYNPLTDTFFRIAFNFKKDFKPTDLIVHKNRIFLDSLRSVYEVSDLKNVMFRCIIGEKPEYHSRFILNGNYGYTVNVNSRYGVRRLKCVETIYSSLTEVGYFDDLGYKGTLISIKNFYDHILAFIESKYSSIVIQSFDTKTRVCTLVMETKLPYYENSFTTFTLNERFFILSGLGYLLEVTLKDGI